MKKKPKRLKFAILAIIALLVSFAISEPILCKGKDSDSGRLIIEIARIGETQVAEIVVINRLTYEIGWLNFHLESFREKGELTFESIKPNQQGSKKLRFRTFEDLQVRNVRVVDADANTKRPSILIRIKR